jgi:ABC-type multidrug transport system fused ATPase/permease subunit
MRANLKEKTNFLLKQLRPYRFVVLSILFFSFVGSTFEGISIGLVVPLLGSLQAIGEIENAHPFTHWLIRILSSYSLQNQILLAVLCIALAIVLKNATFAVSVRLGAWLSTKVSANLRSYAVNLLMSVDIDFHRRARIGEIVGKAYDCPTQMQFIVMALVDMAVNVITFAVLLSLLFALSWQLSLISIVLGIGYLSLMGFYMQKLAEPSEEYEELNLSTRHRLQESLAGIELVKAYSMESRTVNSLRDLIDKLRRLHFRIIFRYHAGVWITDVLGTLAMAILFLSAMAVYEMNSKVLISRLLPFMYIITRLVILARMVNQKKADIVTRWPSFSLIHDLLRTDDKPFLPEGHKTFSGLRYAVQFRSVCFSYRSENKFSLSDLNFTIPKGKTTALVGQSGSGKTTIINLLVRFYDPNSGEILLDEQPLRDFRLESYHNKISVVSQETFIFNDSVKSNIAFGLKEAVHDEIIIEAAIKAGAHDFIMQLPQGYNTIVGDRGALLSGGQKQRISIARAILRDPEILILDEATSALDNVTEREIHHAVLDLSRNRTIVIVAHRLSTIRNADQIIVMKNGCVVETGTEEKLHKLSGEFSRLALRRS